LPQNTVQCLLQTHDGYLWVGTQSGLARYDGLRFTVFDRNNTPAFKTDNVLSLAEGAHNTLWIGTADGLLRLRDHTFTYFSTVPLDSDRHVWAIFSDSKDRVWVGDGGVLATVRNQRLLPGTNLHAGIIRSLFQDSTDDLWVGADEGLLRDGAERGNWETIYRAALRDGSQGARAVCRDGQGNLWFGNEQGLWRWRDGRFKVYRTRHGLSPGRVTSIAEDGEGALWLTVERHINRYKGGQFSRLDSKTGLPDDEMRCVYPDLEGNILVGTARSGLVRLRPRRLVTYTKQDGLENDDVWSICEGPTGELWFGASHGVSRFAGETFSNFPNALQPVYQDRSGSVWLRMEEGLGWLRDGKPELYAPKERRLFSYVSSLYQDRSGTVWVTTGAGVWRLKGGQCDLYTRVGLTNPVTHWEDPELQRNYTIHTNALPGNSDPVGVLEDGQGILWVGSMRSGLHCFHHGQFTTLTTSNGLTSDLVAPLLADPDGTLWVGSDKGLNRLKDGRVTRYTTLEGLAENLVGNLLEDDAGWFWTLGHHGIHRMRRQELNELAEGKRRSIQTISYGEADGMLSSEGNVGVFPNTCQTSDGLLWFPTTRGVVVIEPHFIQTHDRPPPVVVEQVLANDQVIFGDQYGAGQPAGSAVVPAANAAAARLEAPTPPGKPPAPRLAPGSAGLLEFRYTANTFVAPEKVRFRYKLEGHDPDWRDAGLRRAAIYTDLAPGTYRFRVIAINSHGVASQAPAEFAFSLAPFFYQTRGFYVASALGVLLIGLGLHRLRVGMLGRRQAMEQQLALALQRERIAKDMHDDLGASLTQIGLLSEHARRDPNKSPSVSADVEKIADAARQTAQAAEEIVWTVNPRHDTLDSLATYLCQFAREYLEPTAIRCRLDVPGLLPNLRVPSDVRHNLVLFVKEALHNAVKHAVTQQVWVALRFENHTLTLTVTDDGRGFDPQHSTPSSKLAGSGNGLDNMRQRVEAIGGRFELWSQPGKGTRAQAVMKLGGPESRL